MGGTVGFPTYIVLEIPEPLATRIRRFRRLFDQSRALLPTEITITGSSGIGAIRAGEDLDDVLALVDGVAASIQPFEVRFADHVESFSASDTYYLPFQDEAPFQRLHKALAASGIAFLPSPYPFRPHCTLKLRKAPQSQEEIDRLNSIKIPKRPFLLETLAVYCLPELLSPQLLHSTKLGRAPAQTA